MLKYIIMYLRHSENVWKFLLMCTEKRQKIKNTQRLGYMSGHMRITQRIYFEFFHLILF